MPGAWEQPKQQFDMVIATPSKGSVSDAWAYRLSELLLNMRGLRTTTRSWRSTEVSMTRNLLVKESQSLGARYIWWLDSDVLPPLSGLEMLMHFRVPIVSGLVYAKRGEGYPGLWRRSGLSYTPVREYPKHGWMEVDAVPFGCVLTDVRVFDVVPYPWFVWEIEDPRQEGNGQVSEDFFFCRKAQQYGFRIFANCAVACGHEHTQLLDPQGKPIPISI